MTRILAINCGSTSTKVAYFDDGAMIDKRSLDVPAAVLAETPLVLDQLEYRRAQVADFLHDHAIEPATLDMIVARAGCIHHVPKGGAYRVNDLMVATQKYAPPAQHASSLGSLIGVELAGGSGVPVIIYDPTPVDCVDPVAKITGIPEIANLPVFHLLNPKAAGIEYAESIGKSYADLNLIIVQLGGGITMAFHDHGRVADWIYDDEGPLSPQRAGRIPNRFLADFCYESGFDHAQLRVYLAAQSGLAAWFGTQDVRQVEAMIAAGDERARLVYEAMALGVAKGIGELSVVRAGAVDQIILTGGVAHSQLFTGRITELVEFIAPVTIIPGEREMEALAAGAERVLAGLEPIQDYDVLPPGYSSYEEILARPSTYA
ncbi:MAG: butyrate kinase [Propionibacteriaceae bacterium]|jgi:butyrate kinase|nr:butyrate kinase [Propionibacteriaceae bacterium]